LCPFFRSIVKGTLNSRPNESYTVQLFSSPSGNYGRTFIGSKSVKTDGSGKGTFAPAKAVEVGDDDGHGHEPIDGRHLRALGREEGGPLLTDKPHRTGSSRAEHRAGANAPTLPIALMQRSAHKRLSGNCAGKVMFAYALRYGEQEIPYGFVR
jgi:hypothetical protein